MTVKLLKPYKGFEIEKSYETKTDDTIRKNTIVYTAYANDEENALFDAATTLAEMKKKIDIYLRQGMRKDMMTKEQFESNTNYKMTDEEFQKCDCTHCDKKIVYTATHIDEYRALMAVQAYVLT